MLASSAGQSTVGGPPGPPPLLLPLAEPLGWGLVLLFAAAGCGAGSVASVTPRKTIEAAASTASAAAGL